MNMCSRFFFQFSTVTLSLKITRYDAIMLKNRKENNAMKAELSEKLLKYIDRTGSAGVVVFPYTSTC